MINQSKEISKTVNASPQNIHLKSLNVLPQSKVINQIKQMGIKRMNIINKEIKLQKGDFTLNNKFAMILNPINLYSNQQFISESNFNLQMYRGLSLMPFIYKYYLQQINHFISIQDQIDPITQQFISLDGKTYLYNNITDIIKLNTVYQQIQALYKFYLSQKSKKSYIQRMFRPVLEKQWRILNKFKFMISRSALIQALFNQKVNPPLKQQEISQSQTKYIQKLHLQNEKQIFTPMSNIAKSIILENLKLKFVLNTKLQNSFFNDDNTMVNFQQLRHNNLKSQITSIAQ